jgi:heat shock protein HslJ/uncharacterized membrane protein
MKTTSAITLLLLLVLLLSCHNKTNKNDDIPKTHLKNSVIVATDKSAKKTDQIADNIYFKATGTEPFWGLEISESHIKLTTIGDSLLMPHSVPVRAMDANVKRYKLQTESGEMTIQIAQSECTNAMSGKVSPYSVTIDFKRNTDKKPTELQGCGHYITDYRLHDIWVLEKMNGIKITKQDFSKEFPRMELNSTTNSFSGFAGCNRMSGKIFYEQRLLSFANIATTKMMCEAFNKEAEFLKTLQRTTTYKIENNRLTLSNPEGELLIFKKID